MSQISRQVAVSMLFGAISGCPFFLRQATGGIEGTSPSDYICGQGNMEEGRMHSTQTRRNERRLRRDSKRQRKGLIERKKSLITRQKIRDKKEVERLERAKDHAKRQRDFTGEHHSQRGKGQ